MLSNTVFQKLPQSFSFTMVTNPMKHLNLSIVSIQSKAVTSSLSAFHQSAHTNSSPLMLLFSHKLNMTGLLTAASSSMKVSPSTTIMSFKSTCPFKGIV